MNTYFVQYGDGEGNWIPFMIKARSIYDGMAWTNKCGIDTTHGCCISLHELDES